MTFSSSNTGMHDTPDRDLKRKQAAGRDLAEALNWLMPFHYFYEKAGKSLPDFRFMAGEEVPYPYRSLLVHSNDMTPTLAAFHHSKLYLEVHEDEASEAFVMRLVTLHAAASDVPVEYGAIAIQLGTFPEEMKAQIIAGRKPLGALLGEFGVEHYGSPAAYFSVPADERIAASLNQTPGEILFGRCNQLLDRDGIVFADIVEILPRSNESEKWVQHVSSR